ncbi:MAG: NTP transferase domain-containing protein [Coriobacteriales bacterium]|nr:NTP transferase domain-containing protein [Coriobacteriales bacterium]
MKAIIPAAGLGTRFLPASKAIAKEMLPVLERPTIQYVVEEALCAGASEVVVILGNNKPEVMAHFSPAPDLVASLLRRGKDALAEAVSHAGALPVSFAHQDQPRGLGHALYCVEDLVRDERFFVLLGDVLVPDADLLVRMRALSEYHDGASVIAVFEVPLDQVSRFGIIDGTPLDGDAPHGSVTTWRLNDLVEKPTPQQAPSRLAVFGRYLLTPAIMAILARTAPDTSGEIQLTDALRELLRTEEIYALLVEPDEGFDCGTVASWLETNIRLAWRDPHLRAVVPAAGAVSST